MMNEVFEKLDMEALFRTHEPQYRHLSEKDVVLVRTGFAMGATSVNSEVQRVAELFDENITVSLTKALRRKIIAFSLNTIKLITVRLKMGKWESQNV